MERYDQQDKPTQSIKTDNNIKPEYIIIDQEHMAKIVELFLKNISEICLKNSDIKIIKNYNESFIIFNDAVSLENISDTLGKKLSSKLEFIREYYLYKLDDFTNIAYEKNVTAIQEYPYSFKASEQNPNIILYEFIN